MEYLDHVLIKLKRKYSKDEVVSAISKKLSESEIKIGILQDEVEYLNEKLKSTEYEKQIIKQGKIEARKEELYKMKCETIIKQRNEIKKLTNQRNNLIAKCASHNIL